MRDARIIVRTARNTGFVEAMVLAKIVFISVQMSVRSIRCDMNECLTSRIDWAFTFLSQLAY